MKAVLWTKYGSPDVLQYGEADKPIPKDNEVLIKVHAATVTAGDCEMRRFDLAARIWLPVRLIMGIRKPRRKVLGQELAGEIEAVGKHVTRFKPDDHVFAETRLNLGAYAQYACLPATYAMAVLPESVSFETGATLPVGGINALHFLRKGEVRKGETVLINGAGGSIGTYAIQLAKSYGAEVTAVDSTEKLDLLRSIGADHVIDYTKEDFTKKGERYDAIIDVVGTSAFSRSIRALNPNGRYVLGNPRLPGMIRGLLTSLFTTKKVLFELASPSTEDLTKLATLTDQGKIKCVIDRRYPLENVAEAHRYVETGKKQGNVIIAIEP